MTPQRARQEHPHTGGEYDTGGSEWLHQQLGDLGLESFGVGGCGFRSCREKS